MKRRLPTTYQGEVVLAAISLPPVTAEANRQAPSRRHPGRPAAASNAAPIAASANRPAAEGGVTATPSSSTASAANATPSSAARARNRRTQPRAVCTAHPPFPRPGGPRRRRRPPDRPPSRRSRPHPAARPARTQAAAHGSPRTARTAAGARRSSSTGPPPGHNAGTPTRTPAARHTTGRPAGELHATASRHVRIDRERAGPYDGHGRHRLGSLLAVGAKRGEEGSLTFNGDTTILTRPQQAGKRHRQRARPGTRPGRSDSQAVNSCRFGVVAGHSGCAHAGRSAEADATSSSEEKPGGPFSVACPLSVVLGSWSHRNGPANSTLRVWRQSAAVAAQPPELQRCPG